MRGKWTEGPWAIHERATHGGIGLFVGQTTIGPGRTLAHIYKVTQPSRATANAYLIAAAPALYDALERAETALRILSEELPAILPRAAQTCAADAAVCRAALSLVHPPKGDEL